MFAFARTSLSFRHRDLYNPFNRSIILWGISSFSSLSSVQQEIERKFIPVQKLVDYLDINNSSKKEKVFVDRYFDVSPSFPLTTKDLWLRRRDRGFELKASQSLASNTTSNHNDQLVGIDFYNESTCWTDISSAIKSFTAVDVSVHPLMDRDGEVIDLGNIKEASNTDDTIDVEEWLKLSSLTLFANIKTRRLRYQIHLPSSLSVARGSPQTEYHVVNIDIDSVHFLELSPYLNTDMDMDQVKPVRGRYCIGEVELISAGAGVSPSQALLDVFYQLKIDTTPVRGKVLEYLYRYSPLHYQALEDSPLLRSKLGDDYTSPPPPAPLLVTAEATAAGRPSSPSSSVSSNVYATKLLQEAAVNLFFSRKCNYGCKFCFHTAKTSDVLPLQDIEMILSILTAHGAMKLNIAGGEPFLYPDMLGKIVSYAKTVAGFQSVSIISNGSKLKREWFEQYGEYVDMLGISCDSIHLDVDIAHGRVIRGGSTGAVVNRDAIMQHKKTQIDNVRLANQLCRDFGMIFKVNTVVTSKNRLEDMSSLINEVKPDRWKIFQVLPLEGENYGEGAGKLQSIDGLLISTNEFDEYCDRNKAKLDNKMTVEVENNDTMRGSYISIDEYGRFLDCTTGKKLPTMPILNVGIEAAAKELLLSEGGGFDRDAYYRRGGFYPDSWTKSNNMHKHDPPLAFKGDVVV